MLSQGASAMESQREELGMVRIRSLKDVRNMPEGPVKKLMEAKAFLCHDDDEDFVRRMEEGFDDFIGGSWYLFEEGDDPRNFPIEGCSSSDLLSEEWNWCELATLEEGCFFVFWCTNNAGGPCLFVKDEPWIPAELRARLEWWLF